MNFLFDPQDGRSTLRLVDVLVCKWIGGKHAWVLMKFFPCGIGDHNFYGGTDNSQSCAKQSSQTLESVF